MGSEEEDGSRINRDDKGDNDNDSDREATVSSNVEETDPDLLKNTPSNIQRLEDEIEQSEGRRKYLAHTCSPSDGGDVRWYFCKLPLSLCQLAASIPRTEIVGKGEYFRFGMRDSLAIEASFLQREEELLSCWWKEYAECSEGPRGRPSTSAETELPQSSKNSELFIFEEERVGVPVKGGLYEVDLAKRHSFPVYWSGETRRVLRGHWFAQTGGLDWLPLREDVAEQLEYAYQRQVWHRRTFQPSGLFAARVDLQGSTQGLHALFTGEDHTWEAWLNVDASGFSLANFGGNGIKLRRGYAASPSPKPTQDELRQQKEEEMDDYCSQVPVRHLVFMVHGIGQRLEKSNLVDDVTNFRHITSSLAEKHLTSYQRGIQRVLYIPCQWRKGLKFSGESAVEKITLDGVRGLRTTLSATVHDVLYYMSPIYCQEIIDSVSNQLNRLYLKFLKRNPGYDGKVSLYGHSLGSVLSYDILCHQENLSSPFPMDCFFRKHVKEDGSSENISKLSSEPDTRACGTNTLQENSTKDVSGPSTLKNDGTIDSHSVMQFCDSAGSSSAKNKFVTRESDSEIEPCTSNLAADGQDYLSHSNDETKPLGEVPDNIIDTKKDLDIPNMDAGALQFATSENIPGDKNLSDVGDKDMDIIALKSKLEFLEGRVVELEAQLGSTHTRGSDDLDRSILAQGESQKIQVEPDESPMGYRPLIKYTKLEFKVDTFFAVGSPLGVFLAIRNVRIGIGEGREYWGEENINEEMPACRRMFNIFHPYDPVAYRIEPLVCKDYVSKRPVIVPYHRGGKRLHIGFQDFTEDLTSRSQSLVNRLNSATVRVLTVCQSKKQDGLEEAEDDTTDEKRCYGSYMMERLTGSEEERIDHVLQDKTFQHSYISAIGAHTNYWRDLDTALFMLNHLYRNIPEDPEQPGTYRKSKHGDGSKNPFSSKNLDEELPLTFSDSLTENSPTKTEKL